EENYIQLEPESPANTPVTPSEPEGSQGKGKRHSEFLITEKTCTPIATQRNRKPQNSAPIKGKPTLTTCTGKITIIKPVLTSKGKLPKSEDKKFVQGTFNGKHPNNIKYQPEDREGLSRTRRPGRGHLGHSGGWQDTEGNHTHSAIHFPNQQEPQTRGLERHESSSSGPPTPQRFISMEHEQQEVQPSFPLGRTWNKLPEYLFKTDRLQRPYGNHQRLESHQEVQTPGGEGNQDKGEASHYPSYGRTADPDRAYSDSARLTRSRSFPGEVKHTRSKTGPPSARGRESKTHNSEAVIFGQKGAQEPEEVVNNSRISIPINRNITPTQIEDYVVTSGSNLKSDSLWLQLSPFAEKTQEQFAALEASHERMKMLTASLDKIIKNLQEGHAQISKASEETNKRLNLVFEEQHHRKGDRDGLDQDINKLFNVHHSMKPQPQGHVMDYPYHQDGIKAHAMLMNKKGSPSHYQNENMS
ncbi:hypothetical protein O181_116971, partial [Austropuccinia psidii MF-1]|nr:hypothetical protein [Austropuccinia psidii MF-1]